MTTDSAEQGRQAPWAPALGRDGPGWMSVSQLPGMEEEERGGPAVLSAPLQEKAPLGSPGRWARIPEQ